MRKIDTLKTLDECLEMAGETPRLHRSVKQLLLQKISTMPEFRKFSSQKADEKHPAWNNPALKLLLDDAKSNFDVDFTAN